MQNDGESTRKKDLPLNCGHCWDGRLVLTANTCNGIFSVYTVKRSTLYDYVIHAAGTPIGTRQLAIRNQQYDSPTSSFELVPKSTEIVADSRVKQQRAEDGGGVSGYCTRGDPKNGIERNPRIYFLKFF